MDEVEALVVGAGPGGLACAGELAKNGVQVVLVDQAPQPGSKNARALVHGRASGPSLEDVFPRLHEEAPVERRLSSMQMVCLDGRNRARVPLDGLHDAEHAWSYAVDRSRFDAWLSKRVDERAKEAGGGVVYGIKGKGPLVEDGDVVGVVTHEVGEVRADVVVAADGAASELVRGSGLRGWGSREAWWVQAYADLASSDVDSGEEGVLTVVTGDPLGAVRGAGVVVPREEGVRLVARGRLDAVIDQERGVNSLLEELAAHPGLEGLIPSGAEEVGFGATLVPDARRVGLEAPHEGRLLAIGEAAGHGQSLGPLVEPRGTSGGILAARGFLDAREAGEPGTAGARFERLVGEHLGEVVSPPRSALARGLAGVASSLPGGGVSPFRVRSLVNDPAWARAAPDSRFVTDELPRKVAREQGDRVEGTGVERAVRSLEERVGALSWETDVGNPHVRVQDRGVDESGPAVHVCPVSEPSSSWGCFRVEDPREVEDRWVALEWQACVECGACGVLEGVEFEHPRGGKGVSSVSRPEA